MVDQGKHTCCPPQALTALLAILNTTLKVAPFDGLVGIDDRVHGLQRQNFKLPKAAAEPVMETAASWKRYWWTIPLNMTYCVVEISLCAARTQRHASAQLQFNVVSPSIATARHVAHLRQFRTVRHDHHLCRRVSAVQTPVQAKRLSNPGHPNCTATQDLQGTV
eukprot:scaffold7331_cov403-Prasinococcus_capsulatus_cf.AAC.4